ncbi:gephyrin-like molybdotransferase Glp [Martelella endophytica]|uniref:Molybdopterin molybdenumtransferase n=1 Tax=Martelella endophytica TaxID=1486262 RepID=A0A0D5LRZ2_MAREN|nr:gephyrin-like molybdotransferase Glp [Martelella endophytica]AJY46949.1 molybdenum cofactor biosynthesis protein MoaA [Martelella endophytica]
MPSSPLIPVEDARRILLERAQPVADAEVLPLADAQGRVLAEDVAARITQPPFDASAMDGYAVIADDATGPVRRLIGVAAAGDMPSVRVTPGTAMRIFTGAPIPEGADTVVIQENTEPAGEDRVRLVQVPAAGANIRRAGQDFAEGGLLLRKGALLDPRTLSLAAAGGHGTLSAHRRPRVAVLATGDELVPPGTLPGPGQISASGGIAIEALARENGAEVISLGIARDNEDELRTAIRAAKDADVLITIGGASVGDRDLIRPVLASLGVELDFWKIAMRPGKPLMVGRLGAMTVLGLPGNPVSSFVCGLIFVEPLIRRLAGLPERKRTDVARLGVALAADGPRLHYMRARFTDEAQTVVEPCESQDSALLATLAEAECLIARPPHADEAAAGETVEVLRLDPR